MTFIQSLNYNQTLKSLCHKLTREQGFSTHGAQLLSREGTKDFESLFFKLKQLFYPSSDGYSGSHACSSGSDTSTTYLCVVVHDNIHAYPLPNARRIMNRVSEGGVEIFMSYKGSATKKVEKPFRIDVSQESLFLFKMLVRCLLGSHCDKN